MSEELKRDCSPSSSLGSIEGESALMNYNESQQRHESFIINNNNSSDSSDPSSTKFRRRAPKPTLRLPSLDGIAPIFPAGRVNLKSIDEEDEFSGSGPNNMRNNAKRFLNPKLKRMDSIRLAALGQLDWQDLDLDVENQTNQRSKIVLLRLSKMLYEYGCPVKRLESHMNLVAEAMELHGDFAVIPGLVIATIGDPETEDTNTITMRVHRGLDLYRLQQTEREITQIMTSDKADSVNPTRILDQLDNIQSSTHSLYNVWLKILFNGVCSASSLVVFPGGYRELLINFALGILIVGTFSTFQHVKRLTGPLLEFSASLVVSFIAQALAAIPSSNQLCFWTMDLGTLVWLLPGLSITTATMELANGNIISGAVNLFYSIMTSLLLGFGIAIGTSLAIWTQDASILVSCTRQFSNYWEFLLFPLFILSLVILLNSHIRQWPPMFVSGVVGFLVNKYASKYFATASTTVISSLSVSVASNLMHKIFGHRALVIPSLFAGIMLLLPGGLAVKGAANIINSDYNSALQFGFSMLQISASVAVGIFAGTPLFQGWDMKWLRHKFSNKPRKEKSIARMATNPDIF